MVERGRCGHVRGWLLWGLAVAAPVYAQVGAGALTGDISDQAGAAVPGATVTVTASATNLSRLAITDADGRYVVQGLAPGPYRVATRRGREGSAGSAVGRCRPGQPVQEQLDSRFHTDEGTARRPHCVPSVPDRRGATPGSAFRQSVGAPARPLKRAETAWT